MCTPFLVKIFCLGAKSVRKNFMRGVAGFCAAMVFASYMPSGLAAENDKDDDIGTIKVTAAGVDSGDARVDVKRKRRGADRPKRIPEYISTVRLSWEPAPGAVSYQVAIMRDDKNTPENVVSVKRGIYTNGYELDTSVMRSAKYYYWKVCPLDASGRYIKMYSDLQPLVEQELNPRAPKPTTEFESMVYAPLYPVFSWVPTKDGKFYDVRVFRVRPHNSPELIRSRTIDTFICYDDAGYTWPGTYFWQVRARNESGSYVSDWSEPSYFEVTDGAKVAALGDSITHGGGAVSTPPSYVMYNWETYSQVPIKNLGHSGDTVATMNARFEKDVLPVHPKILVIMGGVNDFRNGTTAGEIIPQLKQIGDKCRANGIIPVYATATPINPNFIANWSYISAPAPNWKTAQVELNQWIMQQEYAVDVSSAMTDVYGLLREDYTTDGLHPDMQAKKMIGETISDYLLRTFPGKNLLAK